MYSMRATPSVATKAMLVFVSSFDSESFSPSSSSSAFVARWCIDVVVALVDVGDVDEIARV